MLIFSRQCFLELMTENDMMMSVVAGNFKIGEAQLSATKVYYKYIYKSVCVPF